MSTASRLSDKAAGISFDEDPPGAPTTPPPARTAPGQLIGLQGHVASLQREVEQLRAKLASSESVDITELELDLIDEVPGRRRKLTPEQYEELKENLGANPLMEPVVVIRKPGDRYEMIAGHNRKSIFRELDRPRIPARIVDIDPTLANKLAFYTNLLAPSLSDFEKYWNFKQLQEETGLSHQQLAESAGLSRQHVSRILRFDDLPSEAKELLANNPSRLGSAAAQSLAKIAAEGRSSEVVDAIRKLVDEAITQEQAVKLAKAPAAPSSQVEVKELVVKAGKKKVCQVTSRKGVIGVAFAGADAATADKWAEKIHDFIASELAKVEQD
ncbi:Nucleoid occlusion protein [Paraburkholderia domus]|uniref:ParB/RepB/Spo0J family partition protein n=1 Tax=Paraburkholderia domus TaxID=2793075 RepID=UPI001913CB22|nr:ParB/RepB/Spo0J family partition protein [Paraburkholderia domus]MBK5051772.1 ParB/RepB/Spo0J family partition protein [Burkholderia sp. R-70006]CAE6794171.1 Nucleoid occlusion protein [Paraburkholderia domus]